MKGLIQTLRKRSFRNDELGQSAAIDLMIGGILTILSFVVVFAFWPTLTGSINTASGDANTSTTAGTIIDLIPTIFAAALLVGGIVYLVMGVKKLTSST